LNFRISYVKIQIRNEKEVRTLNKDNNNIRETLAKNIKEHRKRLNLSQRELAETIGVKRLTTVSSWERGANAPDISTIWELCKIFHTSIEELLGVDFTQYVDSITDLSKLKTDIQKRSSIENYFNSIGFSLVENVSKWHYEDDSEEIQIPDEIEYILSKDKQSVTFSQEEFDEIQLKTKEVIEGIFYKKLVQDTNK